MGPYNYYIVISARSHLKGALKRKSLNVEECGHETRNEFHWSQKSHGTQAIIIATQDRTSYVAVTYERSVSTAGSDAIPRLVQLLCGSKENERSLTESLVCFLPCTSAVLC